MFSCDWGSLPLQNVNLVRVLLLKMSQCIWSIFKVYCTSICVLGFEAEVLKTIIKLEVVMLGRFSLHSYCYLIDLVCVQEMNTFPYSLARTKSRERRGRCQKCFVHWHSFMCVRSWCLTWTFGNYLCMLSFYFSSVACFWICICLLVKTCQQSSWYGHPVDVSFVLGE